MSTERLTTEQVMEYNRQLRAHGETCPCGRCCWAREQLIGRQVEQVAEERRDGGNRC